MSAEAIIRAGLAGRAMLGSRVGLSPERSILTAGAKTKRPTGLLKPLLFTHGLSRFHMSPNVQTTCLLRAKEQTIQLQVARSKIQVDNKEKAEQAEVAKKVAIRKERQKQDLERTDAREEKAGHCSDKHAQKLMHTAGSTWFTRHLGHVDVNVGNLGPWAHDSARRRPMASA